jgi:hypothetical protein
MVPASMIHFQLRRMLRFGGPGLAAASRLGVPVNLFDTMRVVLRRPTSGESRGDVDEGASTLDTRSS